MSRRISVTDRVGGGCVCAAPGATYSVRSTACTLVSRTEAAFTAFRKMADPACERSLSCSRSLGRGNGLPTGAEDDELELELGVEDEELRSSVFDVSDVEEDEESSSLLLLLLLLFGLLRIGRGDGSAPGGGGPSVRYDMPGMKIGCGTGVVRGRSGI